LGDKVKQLLGGAYENGDQMFAMNPKDHEKVGREQARQRMSKIKTFPNTLEAK
jgi:hypothetical protein